MTSSYLMENPLETQRLEVKTDPEQVRRQALWCGFRPGMRLLDAGCGTGKVSAILYDMVQPGGSVTGIDASEDRIRHARETYGRRPGLDFHVRNLRSPLDDLGPFDAVWVRFVLEYFRTESPAIVRRLSACLHPGGRLCLLDLDQNCLGLFELPKRIRAFLPRIVKSVEERLGFDPFAGRKLYSYLYDLGYENITVGLMEHHLIYGPIREGDAFNWTLKMRKLAELLEGEWEAYPGGKDAFLVDFASFLPQPRRFIYTPLILCKGEKPGAA